MVVERIVGGPWGANCYAVHDEGVALLIDPGGEPHEILAALEERSLNIVGMVSTHGHFDHVAGAAVISESVGVPLWISRADDSILAAGNLHSLATGYGQPVTRPVVLQDLDEAGTTLRLGPFDVGVFVTPGHTPGSRCLLVGDALFTGDTLLARGAVDSPLPGADAAGLRASLALLATALDPEAVTVYPGHGKSCGLGDALAAADSEYER
jgi:hydroxyacylglutathione hydrolase